MRYVSSGVKQTFLLFFGFLLLVDSAHAGTSGSRRSSVFQLPTLTTSLTSGAWLAASIAAYDRWRPGQVFFAYAAPILTGATVGALIGGLSAQDASSSDWGRPLIGMLVGGAIGVALGIVVGTQAVDSRPVYYSTQAAFVAVNLFTIPLF